LDIQLVEQLVKALMESGAEELSVASGGMSVRIRRGAAWQAETPEEVASAAEPAASGDVASAQEEPSGTAVRATMVGIFHPVSGLGPGSMVERGQVVGLIESMKLMNEVPSEESGVVTEMLAEDGSPVEYGQALMTLMETA